MLENDESIAATMVAFFTVEYSLTSSGSRLMSAVINVRSGWASMSPNAFWEAAAEVVA